MLGDHNTLYAEIGHVLNNTPADYKDLDECFFLNEVDSLALTNTALNLDAAFEQFVICFLQKKIPGQQLSLLVPDTCNLLPDFLCISPFSAS